MGALRGRTEWTSRTALAAGLRGGVQTLTMFNFQMLFDDVGIEKGLSRAWAMERTYFARGARRTVVVEPAP